MKKIIDKSITEKDFNLQIISKKTKSTYNRQKFLPGYTKEVHHRNCRDVKA